ADRMFLLGHEDGAEAAFADLLQQLVRADESTGALGDSRLIDGGHRRRSGRFQEAAGAEVILDEFFYVPFQVGIAGTCLINELSAFRVRLDFHRLSENRFNLVRVRFHGQKTPNGCLLSMRKKGQIGSPKVKKTSAVQPSTAVDL